MFQPDEMQAIRAQFPAFERNDALFLDGPAGAQVPRRVVDALANYLFYRNANSGGFFSTSMDTDEVFDEALRTYATFFGAEDSKEIVFGPNMTSLTFMLSRSLSKTWTSGDEIIVSSLDHDANVAPWILAAKKAGATVHTIDVRGDDCTLDMDHFEGLLNSRTKLVAVGYASNITGTINPVKEIAAKAHGVGALCYVDAVHFAPHGSLDVSAIGCDFLVASSYKFFGPHVGILWGRLGLLDSLSAERVRPASESSPGRWMAGTPNFEGIAGAAEAVRYLASLSSDTLGMGLREQLVTAYDKIVAHEQTLVSRLLEGLECRGDFKIWGITSGTDLDKRVPTVSVTHAKLSPRQLVGRLSERGVYCWAGNHYALPFTRAVGLEPEGTLRVGMLHYNTLGEIERLLRILEEIC